MTVQVTGTNLDVGAALRGYAIDRLETTVGKYVDGDLDGHVRVEKTKKGFIARCFVRLAWGLELQAGGDETGDAHAAIDVALERLDKRLRRHKRRLVDRHHTARKKVDAAAALAMDYVLAGESDEEERKPEDADGGNPAIVAETQRKILVHTVSDAVMALELSDENCLVFRNAASDRLNVIYRRADGNIGWIDPD